MDTKYQVFFTETAKKHIIGIYGYIADNYVDDFAVKNFMQKIDKKLCLLADFPKMYPISRIKDYRKINVDDYLVFYKLDEKQKIAQITAMYHGAQDYQKYF